MAVKKNNKEEFQKMNNPKNKAYDKSEKTNSKRKNQEEFGPNISKQMVAEESHATEQPVCVQVVREILSPGFLCTSAHRREEPPDLGHCNKHYSYTSSQ